MGEDREKRKKGKSIKRGGGGRRGWREKEEVEE